MDFKTLKYFITVVESGTISAAAEEALYVPATTFQPDGLTLRRNLAVHCSKGRHGTSSSQGQANCSTTVRRSC